MGRCRNAAKPNYGWQARLRPSGCSPLLTARFSHRFRRFRLVRFGFVRLLGVVAGEDADVPPKPVAMREPVTLVAFRAETTHEVTPVTHGERHSIVYWLR